MQDETLRKEFTHQSESFSRAAVTRMPETLGSLVDLVPSDGEADWLEVASGPGIVARAIAPKVGSVLGVDMTPAMVALATRDVERDGFGNVSFAQGDATALDLADDRFGGAVTRFSLHHIPVPGRVLAEVARVVRPGGFVVVADHVADADSGAAAWHQEIERLRDPSHWACLTPERIVEAGRAAGLELDHEDLIPFEIDFEEWLSRGSGGESAAELVEAQLSRPPAGAERFRLLTTGDERSLALHNHVTRWRVPE